MTRAHEAGPDAPAIRRARFDALFDATRRPVLAYALRRTREPADAEDAVAETFAVAWRHLDDMPAGDGALPWLYGVTRRILANQRRGSERRRGLLARLFERTAATEPGPAADIGGPAMAALAHLGPDDREILRLVAWEDLDHAAIATAFGISVNAVGIRLHRARKRFADVHARLAPQDSDDLKGIGPSRTSTSMKGGAASRPGRERTR